MSLYKKIHINTVLYQFIQSYSGISTYVRKTRKVSKSQLIWYPGHINKGVEQLNQKLAQCDAIIEVHDCRIPLTGRTELTNSFGQVKPRILLLNKMDLLSANDMQKIKQRIEGNFFGNGDTTTNVIFTQLNDYGQQHKLLDQINEIILSHMSTDAHNKMENYIMVTGIPNVGKSTFINGLRHLHSTKYGYLKQRGKKPASVGPIAGVTRVVSHKILISDGPPRLFVLDSPGIWEPSKENLESVLKMALCGCFNLDSLDREIIVDYMLYLLNKGGHTTYIDHYNMSGPTDDVLEFAQRICVAKGFVNKANKAVFGQDYAPNIHQALVQAVTDFNRGLLGRLLLDDMDEYDDSGALFRNRNTLPLGTIIRAYRPPHSHFPFVWHSG